MTPKEQREARLAAQLRANLRKRKAQGRHSADDAGRDEQRHADAGEDADPSERP